MLYDVFPSTFGVSMPLFMFMQLLAIHIRDIFVIMYEMVSQGFRILPTQQFTYLVNLFSPLKSEITPLSFIDHLAALLNLIPNMTRFAIAVIFIASFVLQPFRRPLMSLWARIIESDKPAFTLLFAGAAAVLKAIHQIVSNL